MPKVIRIDPVTRIEGHGRVVVRLNDVGTVDDAYLTVAEFRGFEKFCEGRMLWEMPTITSRICGFCPVSHHLASVKATEAVLGTQPPPAAVKLRELMHMGQVLQSHALHFYFCALPDFAVTDTMPPEARSAFGLLQTNKAVAQSAIKLRKAGQDIVDIVGGGRLHPVACIPGGMSKSLDNYSRVELFRGVHSVVKLAQHAVKMVKDLQQKHTHTFQTFAAFPSLYMGLVKDERLELYDGAVRLVDQDGVKVAEFEAKDYLSHISETVDEKSWTKHTAFMSGGEGGLYRVASLARLNVAPSIHTPLAQAELQEYRQLSGGKPQHASLFYHYARMIELLYAVERAKELLNDPEILSSDVRVPVKRSGGEGVGVLEAPRGTLFHHYQANDDGRLTKVNLIVSTAHNAIAMNRSIRDVAQTLVKDGDIPEKSLNRIEMAIRCYDPCLSCSSHAHGRMPLEVTIVGPDGAVVSRRRHGDFPPGP